MLKISWTTSTLGTLSKIVSEDEVLTLLESLAKLGFSAEVEMYTEPAAQKGR